MSPFPSCEPAGLELLGLGPASAAVSVDWDPGPAGFLCLFAPLGAIGAPSGFNEPWLCRESGCLVALLWAPWSCLSPTADK